MISFNLVVDDFTLKPIFDLFICFDWFSCSLFAPVLRVKFWHMFILLEDFYFMLICVTALHFPVHWSSQRNASLIIIQRYTPDWQRQFCQCNLNNELLWLSNAWLSVVIYFFALHSIAQVRDTAAKIWPETVSKRSPWKLQLKCLSYLSSLRLFDCTLNIFVFHFSCQPVLEVCYQGELWQRGNTEDGKKSRSGTSSQLSQI